MFRVLGIYNFGNNLKTFHFRLPLEDTEAGPEFLEKQEESMPLVENTIVPDALFAKNSQNQFEKLESELSGYAKNTQNQFEKSSESTFSELPRKAQELLMLQNRFRLGFRESSSKHPFNNLGKHKIAAHQQNRGHLGVFKHSNSMLSSKKRFLLTKNKYPWMQKEQGIYA